MDFFSDREFGQKEPIASNISVPFWNGLIAVIENCISSNSLAESFPEFCPDNMGISGCNEQTLYDKVAAMIPDLPTPLRRITDKGAALNTYGCLDLIELIFYHLKDASKIGELHKFFNHYHYTFSNTTTIAKNKFRDEINTLFQRNGIAYTLTAEGKIIRIVPSELEKVLSRSFKTKDTRLNQLLSEAHRLFVQPKINERKLGLEKLWDAFERAKTYYGEKRTSSTQIIKGVANGNNLLEVFISSESKALTEIGNKFHIRHFETDKVPLDDSHHIDYLYYRMFALIDLFIKELENAQTSSIDFF